MRRRVVQHGPSTLTISLPAKWIRQQGIRKGDEVTLEQADQGLLVTTNKGIQLGNREIDVSGMRHIIQKAIAALYKKGYDEILVRYATPEELATIHDALTTGYIGFEIVDETHTHVTIKKVSEPSREEFKTLFRRIFHFLSSISSDMVVAMEQHDVDAYASIALRDKNVNKLSDFCRRVVNKHVQRDYDTDTALYHVVEQLEKVGDMYKSLSALLQEADEPPSARLVELAKDVHRLYKLYEDVFFSFTLVKVDRLVGRYREMRERSLEGIEQQPAHVLLGIAEELYNLSGATMILHL